MGNKNGDTLFHGTKGNPQTSLEQEEFAINNNGDNNSKEEVKDEVKEEVKQEENSKDETSALINGSDYNTAQSKSVKKVDKVNKMSEHKVPVNGEANSVTQKIKNEQIESERYYDEKGNVYLDIDYTNHGNSKTHPVVPHEHEFELKDGKLIRTKWKEIKKWQEMIYLNL